MKKKKGIGCATVFILLPIPAMIIYGLVVDSNVDGETLGIGLIGSDERIEADENGTFVLESSNETTVLDDKNFFTNIDKKNSIKTQEEESIQNITFCPVCNNEIKREDKFCGHCGYNLLLNQKSRNVCPNCGFEIKTGVNFCGKCGFKIS